MRIIFDIVPRYEHLLALQNDPLVINENGSKVDAVLEIAAEMYEKKVPSVTFEERNHALRLIKLELQKSVLKEASGFQDWGQAGYNSEMADILAKMQAQQNFHSKRGRPF